jgi:hypothetical protein
MLRIRPRSGLGGVRGRKWWLNCFAVAVLFGFSAWMVPLRAQGQQLYMYRGHDGRIMFTKPSAAGGYQQHVPTGETVGTIGQTVEDAARVDVAIRPEPEPQRQEMAPEAISRTALLPEADYAGWSAAQEFGSDSAPPELLQATQLRLP